MASKTSQINIIIAGDPSQATAALAQVRADLQATQQQLDQAGAAGEAAGAEIAAGAESAIDPLEALKTAGEETETVLKDIGKTFLVFAIAQEGLSRIKEAIDAVTESAIQQQRIDAQTAAVLTATGGAAGVTADQVAKLGEQFGQTTLYTHGQVEQGENLLLTFRNIGSDIFPQATQAALDMSTALGQDLNASVLQLGKALDNPVQGMTALRRAGVDFTADQQQQIKTLVQHGDLLGAQKIILQEIADEMGGSATAAGNTYQGQLAHLNDTMDTLKETIGTGVLPALTQLAQELNTVLKTDQVKEFFEILTEGFRVLATGNAWNAVFLDFETHLGKMATDFADLMKKLSGGRVDLTGLVADWQKQVQAGIDQMAKQVDPAKIAQPVHAALSGQDGGPLSAAEMERAGRQVMASYFAGFNRTDFTVFDDLKNTVSTALADAGNTDPTALLDLEPTIAKAVQEMHDYGQVSQETLSELHDALGTNVGDVDRVIAAYEQLKQAQSDAALAQVGVSVAQGILTETQAKATAAETAAQQAVDQATATQKAHAEALKETTQALQDQINVVNQQAQAVAKADQQQLDNLNAGLQQLQDQAQADADAFAALEAPLQAAATAAQDAATQHAGAYQAILKGDVDYYQQQIGQQDDLTQKIIAKWDAEYSGLLRQKNGDDQRLFEAQAAQHKQDYDLDLKIQAARTQGNAAEVAALQRQKQLKDQQAQANMQVLRDAAQVSADNQKRAQDQINADAQNQADQDAVAKKRADDALKAVQDQAAAKKQSDDDAIARQNQLIKQAQDQQKQDLQYWADKKQALQDNLTDIQRNGQKQADLDQQALNKANETKTTVDKMWNDRIQSAKDALTKERDYKKALDDEATKLGKNLDLIKQQIAAQDAYNKELDQTNTKLGVTNQQLQDANQKASQTPPPSTSRPAGDGRNTPGFDNTPPDVPLPATDGPRTAQGQQVTAASATVPQVVNFHFPNVTGNLTQDAAQQAGATAAKSFALAYRDATTSGAGRVGVNTA